VIGSVVELAAPDAQRLPERAEVEVEGIKLSQLRIAKDRDPYPSVLAWLTTESADQRVVAEK
jgi:hypothetical protein